MQGFDDAIGTNYPIIRFADVLLMYAEAANENGNKADAIDAINRVRARSNMPTYPDSGSPYSVDQSSSTEAIFEAIVHERRVELAFENHRYNDVRRWGIGEDALGDLGYQPKHRWMPLPQGEVDTNDELEQNPDW